MRRNWRLWLLMACLLGLAFMGCMVSWLSHLSRNVRYDSMHERYASLYGRPSNMGLLDRLFGSRIRAVILILCRNSDLDRMAATLENFEARFNHKFAYPYLFLNDQPFEERFMQGIRKIVAERSRAQVDFEQVPHEHWSYPGWIDQERAAAVRAQMGQKGIIYGDSESYRFMCRFFSGFFYRHPAMANYDYYWRIEPGVEFTCDIDYDPFRFMLQNDKQYGFVITMREIAETIPSLWRTVLEDFIPRHPRYLSPTNSIRYFGAPDHDGYNGCHFWSNFEIASLSLFRSPEYGRFFETLDRAGGFFYERWGDAPIHSIAVGLFLEPSQVHYFYDFGYRHAPFSHCPADWQHRQRQRCSCDPFENGEISHGSCQHLWEMTYAGY